MIYQYHKSEYINYYVQQYQIQQNHLLIQNIKILLLNLIIYNFHWGPKKIILIFFSIQNNRFFIELKLNKKKLLLYLLIFYNKLQYNKYNRLHKLCKTNSKIKIKIF